MKLVLLQPPIQDFYDTSIRLQPVGLGYLKAAVRKHVPVVDVIIKDYHHGWGRKTIPVPKDLDYLKEYFPWPDQSPFSSFFQYFHFGASFDALAEEVAREKPDMVGISSLFSPYYREVFRCAEEIKARLSVPILVGGSHASALPEMMLKHQSIDFVIRGEGERPLVEFLQAWLQGKDLDHVPNLGYKQNGSLYLNPLEPPFSIEELPLPDLSDFSEKKYQLEGNPLCFIVTSRGCPHHCAFCSVQQTFGSTYRRRSNESTLREIKQRVCEGYRVFDFEDDNLTFDMEAMKALCRELHETFPSGKISFRAMNGISFHDVDGELLRLMKEAGFTHLNLSLVSVDPMIHKSTRRPFNVEKYQEVVSEAVKLGFSLVSYQILGLPGERVPTMMDTLVFNARLPVLLGASPFYLCPRSPIAKEFPDFTEKDALRARLTAMGMDLPHCGRDDVYTLFVISRIINFFKGISFKEQAVSLADALKITRDRGKRFALGTEVFERLMAEGILFAATKKGLKPLPRFKTRLFHDFWSRLDQIGTQKGKTITLIG
jgi:radical SAM superfamily enzyme YgiQ (UPF0313 family)